MEKSYSILLVEDHPLFRKIVADTLMRLVKGVKLVAEVAGGREALRKIDEQPWDLMILDIQMQDPDGLEVLKQISQKDNPPPVLVCSSHDHMAQRTRALGAKGFISKFSSTPDLVKGVEAVLRGEEYFETALNYQDNDNNVLTPRETDVLRLLCQQTSIEEISALLAVSTFTVDEYRQKLLKKTRSTNVTELCEYAVREGYIQRTN